MAVPLVIAACSAAVSAASEEMAETIHQELGWHKGATNAAIHVGATSIGAGGGAAADAAIGSIVPVVGTAVGAVVGEKEMTLLTGNSTGTISPLLTVILGHLLHSFPNENYSSPNENYSSPNENYSSPNENYSSPNENYSSPNENFAPSNNNRSVAVESPMTKAVVEAVAVAGEALADWGAKEISEDNGWDKKATKAAIYATSAVVSAATGYFTVGWSLAAGAAVTGLLVPLVGVVVVAGAAKAWKGVKKFWKWLRN